VTSGTVFDRSRTPLRSWFTAAWYRTERADGISALALQQELGLASYKSAWSIEQKQRAAMKPSLRGRLRGRIEVASYDIGGSEPNRRFTIATGTEIRPAGERHVRIARIPDDSTDSMSV
jgi:hypothetical protein